MYKLNIQQAHVQIQIEKKMQKKKLNWKCFVWRITSRAS